MKKLLESLQNIWSVKTLRERILLTIGLIAVYRLGCYVVLPGVDVATLEQLNQNGNGGQGLLGLVNAFTGGAFLNISVFALGIMPYISASIIVQLLGFAIPYFQKLQKDGESGTRKLNQITRFLTIGITAVQGSAYLKGYIASGQLNQAITADPTVFWLTGIIILTAGTVFCMWLGEKITEQGIGNGISLLIMIGIIAALPSSFLGEVDLKMTQGGGLLMVVVEMAVWLVVVMASIALVQAVRKIQIQFVKRMSTMTTPSNAAPQYAQQRRGPGTRPASDQQVMGNRDYIPVKLNASGVMPIIFAQALMFLPSALFSLFSDSQSGILADLSDFTSVTYNVVFFFMVVIFTYVYTALIVNPQQYAEHLKRQNAFIPGVERGKPTADFIETVTSFVTLPGSLALGAVAILPGIAAAMGVDMQFALFFGGTSLLIMVGVVLDTLQQIQNELNMRKYDDLVSTESIGESGQQPIGATL